jgi:methylaspartate mutase epsilon subunit
MHAFTREALTRAGFTNVEVATVFHQYMAAFPSSPEDAEQLIFESAVTGTLAGATRIITKTPVEATRIPTVIDNIAGLDVARRGVAAARGVTIDEAAVAEEGRWIRAEAAQLLDSLFFCGNGDLALGVVRAFARGLLDIPFAPSLHNRGEVLTLRDSDGAVRYLTFGQLPFDREIRQFHEYRLAERRRHGPELRTHFAMVEEDVLRFARAPNFTWPLG